MAGYDITLEQDLEDLLSSDNVFTTVIENEDGGADVVFEDEERKEDRELPVDALDHSANLALFLDEQELTDIAMFCDERFTEDKISNEEFFTVIADGMSRLGMTIEELSDPFPGASPVTHPIVLESALKTQAKIMGEIFSGKGLVDTYITSKTSPDILDRANRIKKYMDFQYLYRMDEFVPETEKLSFRYALTGNAYRKYYYDSIYNRPRSKFIAEDKLIVNSNATTLRDTDFYTELMVLDRHTFEQRMESGEYKEIMEEDTMFHNQNPVIASDVDSEIIIQTGDPMGFANGDIMQKDKYVLREHFCYYKMPEPFNDGEERALPYIVTVEEGSNKVVSIRRNWDEEDPLRLKLVWHAHYKLIPGLGFHGLGYIHILGNFQFALTQIMRSLIDAGQFANLQGGFKTKGVRFTRDSSGPVKMGEFRDIDTGGKNIQDVLMPLQFKEPSQVLHAMFGDLDSRVQRFADSAEQVIADSTNYGPVGTTVALLEASTKFVSGILKRFYTTLTEEFRILYYLNKKTLDNETAYYIKGEENLILREDFEEGIDVIPSADPNLSSSAHRIALAQAKLTAAQQDRDLHDLRQAYTEFYLSLGMEQDEVDRLLPRKEEAQQQDPLSDIIAVSGGKPIKAFEGQDHDAHIRFKSAFLQDPQGGASPRAAGIRPLVEANIAEHMLLKYVSRVKGAMQSVDMQQAGSDMALAQAAELAAKVNTLENNMDLVEAQDPAIMLALAEQKNAQVRENELEHKKVADKAKLLLQERDQQLKAMKLAKDADLKELQIEAGIDGKKMDIGARMIEKALTDTNKKPT